MKRSRKMDSDRREKKKARHITEEEIDEYLSHQKKKKAAAAMRVNLNEKFVWRKKIERDLTQGVLFSVKSEKKRQKERMAEIEKMKKRREERAIEKAQHEEDMALLARERARADFQYWEKKEEDFHFYQSKLRSEIRDREGRIKAIDVLTKHLLLNGSSDDFDIEINEVFKGLTAKEMEEIRDDIKMHLDRDMATPTHREYWESLFVVCDWELAEVRKMDALDRARVRDGAELLAEERGVHSSIEADVKKLLQGKSHSELKALEPQTYRPRKPKYLNRVHTGYEWNKYNQMHYNQDNRPPKMVQGYKFNLFYPGIDKTPGYTIENDGNAESCIIRFHAVPPYEDIAFRIVNKEWDFSNGFKCTFEWGILCLYFNFKRYCYRS